MNDVVKLAFASGSDDLIPDFLAEMSQLLPGADLLVISEFPPPAGYRWVPYIPARPSHLNEERIRAAIGGRRVLLAGIILQPNMPYWKMRMMAWKNWPLQVVAFNDSMNHWMVRPRSFPTIGRHLLWRLRNLIVSQSMPGSASYTLLWRLRHPRAFQRPVAAFAARMTGKIAYLRKTATPPPRAAEAEASLPDGVSVVIPSHNGRHLLETLLPGLMAQLPANGEVIVVDNGSSDGTRQWLADRYAHVKLITDANVLGFAGASNRGIRAASFRHLLMLNNDMVVEADFVSALLRSFDRVPDLFAATAQIFFPEGMRREETGKAVRVPAGNRTLDDFPVRCDLPIEGENDSYVLYGSGGCTLYDTAKLRELGGFGEQYKPAYVEDLDLGFRAWQRGWPTVFAAGARVLHFHRQTSAKLFAPEQIDLLVERHYLRFLAGATAGDQFRVLWKEAIDRLNHLSARMEPVPSAAAALAEAWRIPASAKPAAAGEPFLDLTSGEVAVFPGRPRQGRTTVLIASPYMPFPLSHGGAVRMFNLMQRAATDFDQVLVVFADELKKPPAEVLAIFCEIVVVKRTGSHLLPFCGRPQVVEEFASGAFAQALRQTIRKWRPAVAQLEFTQMAQYAGMCGGARTILVEHDVTLDLYEQLLRDAEDWETRFQRDLWVKFETAAWKQVDSVIVMSEKDKCTVGSDKAIVVANGVDLDRFQPSTEPPQTNRILFVGSFAHLPNLMAIQFFLGEVWPLLADLKPRLHIIAGSHHEYFLDLYRDRVHLDFAHPGIELQGFVSDVRPAYRSAAVVIAPLVASAGTNIKVMEAMAMGKAVAATPAGINGLDLVSGESVMVGETAEEFASAVRVLIQEPQRRAAIESEARSTVEQYFSWDKIAVIQKELYLKLAGHSGQTADRTKTA